MKARPDCPGCGHSGLTEAFTQPGQPVVLNYRFRSAAAARQVPRGEVTLQQCQECGLVFNATFDPAVIPYDENYENRQCFSAAFTAHLEQLARELTDLCGLRGGRVLEVGCGKGDFLRLLCTVAGAEGEGYDTSYEAGAEPEQPGLAFHRRYISAAEVRGPFQAVICRHVVEHVPEIGAFLRELRAIAAAAGDPVVVLETPRFEWIVEQLSLWDVFYEHCNYFPCRSLAYLCGQAGFRVVAHHAVFGEQYQLLALRLAHEEAPEEAPGVPAEARLSDFARAARAKLQRLAAQLAAAPRGWAMWGAGAKGVALLNQLPEVPPRGVIDSNPAKQGGVIPGTELAIVGPEDSLLEEIGLVLIANPNYATEIRQVLQQRGFSGQSLTL